MFEAYHHGQENHRVSELGRNSTNAIKEPLRLALFVFTLTCDR